MPLDKATLDKAAGYVLGLYDAASGGFIFAGGNAPTLMGTAYAIHALEFLGALDRLNPEQKRGVTNFLMANCRADASFRDPLFDPATIATASHDEAYFDGETTCFVQNALDAIGASPPPPRIFPEHLLTPEGLRAEFDSYDWRDPHLNSNRVMFWMAQFAHEIERHGRKEFEALMDFGLDWMDENQSPRTGLWSGPVEVSLSAAMAATFHYTFFYSYRNRPIRYLDRIIDSCIELQMSDGLFGRGNDVGQTCLDYDALDLLAKATIITDYRKPDVVKCFDEAAIALKALGNDDGGFANLKERRAGKHRVPAPGLYHTGLKICSCDNLESNSFSTWFRLIAWSLCDQPAWLESEQGSPVCYRRLPWLGYHDIEKIRGSYVDTFDLTRKIDLSQATEGRVWHATNLDRLLSGHGARFIVPIPDGMRVFAIRVKVSGDAPIDIRVSYRRQSDKHYSGERALKQSMPSGENIALLVVGEDHLQPEFRLDISPEKPAAVVEDISLIAFG